MKNLTAMVTSLVLCGAGIAALLGGNASADTPRRPMMIAMLTPSLSIPGVPAAAPSSDGGGTPASRRPDPTEMAARHKQMCQDIYARQAGELAYLEARLNLASTQQPLFDRWKSVELDIAKRDEASCSTRELPSRAERPAPTDVVAREEEILKRRLADLEAERPVLSALYASLSAGQRETLDHPENGPMVGGRMMAHRMFAAELGPRTNMMGQRGPGPRPMRPGLRPPVPPPAPQ